MNKLLWFVFGSVATVIGAGIAALIEDKCKDSGGSSESTDGTELLSGGAEINNDAESANSHMTMNDNEPKSNNNNLNGDKGINNTKPMDNTEPKLNDNADLKPSDGTYLKSNTDTNAIDETYPQVDKDS